MRKRKIFGTRKTALQLSKNSRSILSREAIRSWVKMPKLLKLYSFELPEWSQVFQPVYDLIAKNWPEVVTPFRHDALCRLFRIAECQQKFTVNCTRSNCDNRSTTDFNSPRLLAREKQ